MPAVTRTEMRPVKYHAADTFWGTYIISVISANIAELGMMTTANNKFFRLNSSLPIAATYPLDLTKTRLQIQGEASAAKLLTNVKPKNVRRMARYGPHET